MLFDKQLMFCEDQAVTATADATNVIALTSARDIGVGEELTIALLVTETMDDSGDDSTLAVALVTDDNESLSSDSTVRALITLPALTAAGSIFYFKVPIATTVAWESFIGLTFTPANGNLSAGKFTAGIVKDIQKWQAYASGFTIS